MCIASATIVAPTSSQEFVIVGKEVSIVILAVWIAVVVQLTLMSMLLMVQ